MKWTQEQRDKACAALVSMRFDGSVRSISEENLDVVIDLTCQRNALLGAVKVMRKVLLDAGGDPMPTLDGLIAHAEGKE